MSMWKSWVDIGLKGQSRAAQASLWIPSEQDELLLCYKTDTTGQLDKDILLNIYAGMSKKGHDLPDHIKYKNEEYLQCNLHAEKGTYAFYKAGSKSVVFGYKKSPKFNGFVTMMHGDFEDSGVNIGMLMEKWLETLTF